MCIQDVAISRRLTLRPVDLGSNPQDVKIKANPSRVMLIIDAGVNVGAIEVLYTLPGGGPIRVAASDTFSTGNLPVFDGSSIVTGPAEWYTRARPVIMTVQTHPGIISEELRAVISGVNFDGILEGVLDPEADAVVQEVFE